MIEYKEDNLNRATTVMLSHMYSQSELSDDGMEVEGEVEGSGIRIELLNKFFPYKFSENNGWTWGSIIRQVKIEEYEAVEELYKYLVQELIKRNLIKREYETIKDSEIIFTFEGFKYWTRVVQNNLEVKVFDNSKVENINKKQKTEQQNQIIIPQKEEEIIKNNILEIAYDYKNEFNKKMHIEELALRFFSQSIFS